MRPWTNRLLFFGGLLLLWEALCRAEVWPPYLLPSPEDVVASLGEGMRDGTIPVAIGASLTRLGIGFGMAILIGTGTGILLAVSRFLKETLGALVLGLQSLPSICWFPLALLWFGLSEKAVVFVVVMGALLSIVIATDDGVKNTPPLLVRAGRTMGMRGVGLYARVVLPSALPAIVSGMKLGWSFAWRSLMAGELLFVSAGLGQLLTVGRDLNDMSLVIAVMLLIVAVGLAVERLLFGTAERAIRRRWGLVGARG